MQGAAVAERQSGSTDEAGDSRFLRARAMDSTRQSPERKYLVEGTAGLRPVTNWAENLLGWDGFESGGEGGKEVMAGKEGNSL